MILYYYILFILRIGFWSYFSFLWITLRVIFQWLFFSSKCCYNFLIGLFHPSRWPTRSLCPEYSESHRWPTFGFISFTSHPPCWITWFPLVYTRIVRALLSSRWACYSLTNRGKINESLWRQNVWISWILTSVVWSVTAVDLCICNATLVTF